MISSASKNDKFRSVTLSNACLPAPDEQPVFGTNFPSFSASFLDQSPPSSSFYYVTSCFFHVHIHYSFTHWRHSSAMGHVPLSPLDFQLVTFRGSLSSQTLTTHAVSVQKSVFVPSILPFCRMSLDCGSVLSQVFPYYRLC